MSIENPTLFAITMLQDYKGDLARRDFPDNDEGDHQQRVNESKRASVDAAIAGLRNAHVQQVSVPDERAAFEKWGETLFFSACFERHESDEYAGRGLQGAWLGWQARAAMAEPASAQTVATDQEGKPSYASQMAKRWESIMPAAQPEADPCPKCIPGTVCRTPKCGRLRAQQHKPIGIDSEGGSHD